MSDLQHLREIYTAALVSDALDLLGRRHQVLGYDLVPMSGAAVLRTLLVETPLRPLIASGIDSDSVGCLPACIGKAPVKALA